MGEVRAYDSKYVEELEAEIERLRAAVAQQAEDDGLWFIAETAPEAYLQNALRYLHALIEQDARALAALKGVQEQLRASEAYMASKLEQTLVIEGELRQRIAELEAKVQAQSEYIMTANRVNNNLKKELRALDENV